VSASEKLRALDAKIRADEDAMGELSVYAPWVLTALPQIVAVVEAAEEMSEGANQCVICGERPATHAPDCALAALDEALS
jgi:hypothetical protein